MVLKANLKLILYLLIYLLIVFYAFIDIINLPKLFKNYNNLLPQYKELELKKENIDIELSKMKIKVSGIKESGLDKSILEERAKIILNLKKKNEIIIH